MVWTMKESKFDVGQCTKATLSWFKTSFFFFSHSEH